MNQPIASALRTDISLRWRILVPLVTLCAAPASLWAQPGQNDSIPSRAYFAAFSDFYSGEYRDALNTFLAEGRGGIKTAQSRWIDSVCYHTMAGECYYQMGQYPAALEQYTSALRLYVAYSDWMLRLQFRPPTPANVRVDAPWGQSKRGAKLGHFQDTYLMGQGRFDNNPKPDSLTVVQPPVLISINAVEIVRTTALAIRRRRELLGPLCKYDPLTADVVNALSRPGQGHWSEAWSNAQLGAALASKGDDPQAAAVLNRAVLVGGEYDHPLTATALLELGRLALVAGDLNAAARYFDETTYAAVHFQDLDILEEAFRYGQLTHSLANQKGIYPPLSTAVAWAKAKGYRQLHASLALLAADSLAAAGQTQQATAALAEARTAIGRRDMLNSPLGAKLNHLTALTAYQSSNVAAGDQALAAALAFEQANSLWLFQINLADKLYTSGDPSISDRVGVILYETLLRDPTPVDWAINPLECLTVLVDPHSLPMEHWFEAVLKRNKDQETALEIADRIRRHRFLSTLPMGGRLLSLRWLLEGPQELLNQRAQLQKQDLLARYPRYAQLAQQAKQIQANLANRPAVEEAADARREQSSQLAALATIAQAQELILREIAVRREPAEIVFPPLRKTKDIQAALPEGQLLLSFFVPSSNSRNMYAFLFSKEKYALWRTGPATTIQRQAAIFLRELGNFDQNHEVNPSELAQGAWKKSGAKLLELLLEKSNVDLAANYDELVIVPDGFLWYVPFEALPIGKGDDAKPLLAHAKVRYAPTAGLALPYSRAQKPKPITGVVLGKLFPQDREDVARAAFDRLSRDLPDTLAIVNPLPGPSSIYRGLFDRLVVLDEIKSNEPGAYDWSPVQLDRGKSGSALASWFTLPWGGPQEVILPGFHTPAENGLKKATGGGNDLFLSICGLMASGTRTILISRWRMGGQTSFDLVREFTQELPHTTAADSWQRSVQLAMSKPLDPELEPRVKRGGTEAGNPTSEHPLFWSGYLLVDTGGTVPVQVKDEAPLPLDFKEKLKKAVPEEPKAAPPGAAAPPAAAAPGPAEDAPQPVGKAGTKPVPGRPLPTKKGKSF